MGQDIGSAIEAALASVRSAPPLGIAFSGGADSTCLLHAAARAWPGRVHALHVNHGLQEAAALFEAHARETASKLGVPFHVAHPHARHAPGESPEDAARRARYAAIATLAGEAGVPAVLLAQHADDQVETLLLALSRGAGLPGLAAMPRQFERHGVRFERPFLGLPGPALREWLARERIAFTEDPSNADTSFTRNRIRHEVLPALAHAFPQFRETFARSARHAAEAQGLLEGVARDDLGAMGGSPLIDALRLLAPGRQANLLRHWLRSAHGESASAAQMAELLSQVAACTTRGHGIRIKVGRGFVVRDGPQLQFTGS